MREPETGRLRDVEFISIGTLHLVESYLLYSTYYFADFEMKRDNGERGERLCNGHMNNTDILSPLSPLPFSPLFRFHFLI